MVPGKEHVIRNKNVCNVESLGRWSPKVARVELMGLLSNISAGTEDDIMEN